MCAWPNATMRRKAYGVGVAKAALYPFASLSGSITPLHVSSPGKSSISYWAIGPAINLPIFTGGQNWRI